MDKVADAVKRMSLFTAQLYYHLTKAMVEDYGKEGAKKTIAKGIKAFGLERGENIANTVLAKGLKLTNENLDKYYDMPISEGWSPEREIVEKTKEDKKMRVISGKIGRLYCEVDLAIREGYNENLLYEPEKNILDGDECCSAFTKSKK